MNISTAPDTVPDAHEKTIDLRIERLRTAIDHATAIAAHPAPAAVQVNRTLTVLVENRVFVTAHAQTLIEDITGHGDIASQDALIQLRVRPLTTLVDSANVAIARMRHLHGSSR